MIGCGGHGRHVANVFSSDRDTEVVYLADPHERQLSDAAKQFSSTAKVTDDLRLILEDKSIDAVIVATPVHWHAPATILACNASKHVYVEKPCSHNIHEGELIVDAARRNNCVVQHGIQSRTTSTIMEGIQLLREGIIGDVLVARAWNSQRRTGTGRGTLRNPPM